MMFAFWCYSKFLAGDALGWSSLVANSSNTYRITAATCYLRCRLHRENEWFGASNSRASSRYLREKIVWLREPFHPGCTVTYNYSLILWGDIPPSPHPLYETQLVNILAALNWRLLCRISNAAIINSAKHLCTAWVQFLQTSFRGVFHYIGLVHMYYICRN